MWDFKSIILAVGLAYLAIATTPGVLVREALKTGINLPFRGLVV